MDKRATRGRQVRAALPCESRDGNFVTTSWTVLRYVGAWLHDTEHGQGTYTWANGDMCALLFGRLCLALLARRIRIAGPPKTLDRLTDFVGQVYWHLGEWHHRRPGHVHVGRRWQVRESSPLPTNNSSFRIDPFFFPFAGFYLVSLFLGTTEP